MKIAVLLPNWIGDVVMATPTLRAIRRHAGPDADIAGIMKPYVSRVLEGTTWLNRTFLCDRTSDAAELRTASLLRQLRQWKPDTMLLLPNSFWGAALAWSAGARQRIGYARNGRGLLLSHALKPLRDGRKWKPVSAIDYYLQLAYAWGCPPESPQMELGTLPLDEARVDKLWHKLGLNLVEKLSTMSAT